MSSIIRTHVDTMRPACRAPSASDEVLALYAGSKKQPSQGTKAKLSSAENMVVKLSKTLQCRTAFDTERGPRR